MVLQFEMIQNRDSGEIYKREDGLRLLGYLGLLSDDIADYVLSHFSSTAHGPDLMRATRIFYSKTIIQLVQTGEFHPDDLDKSEEDKEEEADSVCASRFHRFDMALKRSELEQKLGAGIKLDEILREVDISKYVRAKEGGKGNQKV